MSGVDEDCNGEQDEENAIGCTRYYRDGDGDQVGAPEDSRCLCQPEGKYSATVPGDCDDDDANINPSATDICNGVDDDCNQIVDDGLDVPDCEVWYHDADGDGYGDPMDSRCQCGGLGTYDVKDHSDCYDQNANAHPGQTEWFMENRGDGSFDYDCSNQVEMRLTDTGGSCVAMGYCSADPGWKSNDLPGCGESAQYVDGCNNSHCAYSTQVQGCH